MTRGSDSPNSSHAAGDSLRREETDLAGAIRAHAHSLGFDHCCFAPVEQALHADFFDLWLDEGRAGEMTYLERHGDKRRNPLLLTPRESASLQTVIVLGVHYRQLALPASVRNNPSRGVIASYAWSDDYHEVVRPLLYEIDAYIRIRTGRTTVGKCLVDTGPVLERDWAQRAGVGFTGKNCCTIHPVDGSWLILATVMVPERIDDDALTARQPSAAGFEPSPRAVASGLPRRTDFGAWDIPLRPATSRKHAASGTGTCGACTRCLDACPTDAFVGPYHLDPARCISYWTIESHAPIPRPLRPLFGNRIFGCDVCQEVCPWNRRLARRTPMMVGLRAREDCMAPPLLEGFRSTAPYWLSEEAFRERFRRSPAAARQATRHGA